MFLILFKALISIASFLVAHSFWPSIYHWGMQSEMEKHFCHCLLPPSCFRLSIYTSICPRRRTEVYKRFTVKLKGYPNSLGSIKRKKISKQKSIWMAWVYRKVFKFCISHRILLPFKFTLLLATLIDSLISFTITFWWFIVHTIVNFINVFIPLTFKLITRIEEKF